MCVSDGGLGLGWCGCGLVGYAVAGTLPMYMASGPLVCLFVFFCEVGFGVGFWRVVKAWWASRFSIGVDFPSGGLVVVVVVVWWLRFVTACTALWWLDASVRSESPSLCFEKKALLITWILGWVSITSVGLGLRFSGGNGRMLYSYWAHTEGESDAGRLYYSREGEARPCRRKNQLST